MASNATGFPNVSSGYPSPPGDQVNHTFNKALATRGPLCPVPNTQTLTAALTLTMESPWVQQITPGAARNVTMPATSNVFAFFIVNRSTTASHVITILDSAAATVGTIGAEQSAWVMSDGTTVTISRAMADTSVSSAYTQTYSTANRTVANPTAAALTDSTTGSAGATLAAGAGCSTLVFYVDAADLANGDVLTTYVPGYKFKILKFDARCAKPVTTGAKAATLNMEIQTTDLTGGVIALSGTYAQGAAQAGSAVTAANTGSATDSFSIEASAVTTFVEGAFWLVVQIQNMDTADAFASLSAEHTKIVADDLDNRQTITAIIDDGQAAGQLG